MTTNIWRVCHVNTRGGTVTLVTLAAAVINSYKRHQLTTSQVESGIHCNEPFISRGMKNLRT